VKRITAAIVIGLLGVAIVRLASGTAYLSYVKPGMRFLLLAAGLLMIGLAIASAWDALRAPGPPVGTSKIEHTEAPNGHLPRIGLLLLIPFVTIFVIAPPPLGAYVAERSPGNALVDQSQPLPPLPSGDPVPIALPDYVWRAQADGGSSLKGRRVLVEGFVVPLDSGGWHLARIRIACCAADGLPYSIAPRGLPEATSTPPANTWLRIVGTWAPGEVPNVPAIDVESMVPIPAPIQPYA